ncbi:MAG: hypothetical protein EP346_04000 [Bacteroidetes bacterium]|uniref:Uncharacterized protein n=1 Tax=Phaeocystidibacter marisrubri TaxID=1577780 RepID=A0A6L3ZEF8_9FLAO|nr:hypothetical protein [Phaeocystidibacter marisrubri]KAB2816223.1 hypothetical protein F8C82_11085 [Phaeocystidibacter marisrubri]TNE30269.1 MAG: hypothetical protein EP346_04000 [Bacteroidota bacterium]GGH67933.1 hypothetical protein GCM10011318_07450 [Phaeocystidibacter marisrubri]
MEKKRIIVDYKNINPALMEVLTDIYPGGYEDYEDDIITYKNAAGETVKAIPLETDDTKYLFKISSELKKKVEAYIDDMDEDDESESSEDSVPDVADESDED